MSEMRERIARAIGDRYQVSGQIGDIRARRPPEAVLIDIADAVLDVLAEPDEGMIEAAYNAGLDIYWSYRSDGRQGGAEDVWTAMLQAARTPGAIEETWRRG